MADDLVAVPFLGRIGSTPVLHGKVRQRVAMLLTCGGLGIWSIIDLVMIATGSFTDAQGRR